MSYNFSQLSRKRMEGLHPDLVKVAEAAIKLTKQDFRIQEGLRSVAQQRIYVNKGFSQTMNSRHLTGKAVDVVPLVDGKIPLDKHGSWDLEYFYPICTAWQLASKETGIVIRWGGCWQELSSFSDPKKAVEAYAAKRRAEKRKAFIDAPHYELPERIYG